MIGNDQKDRQKFALFLRPHFCAPNGNRTYTTFRKPNSEDDNYNVSSAEYYAQSSSLPRTYK